jgi:hypothetical protein
MCLYRTAINSELGRLAGTATLQSCCPSFSTMEVGIAEYNPLSEGDFSDALAVVVGDGSVSCDAAG